MTWANGYRSGSQQGKANLLEEIQSNFKQLHREDFEDYLFNKLPELLEANKTMAEQILKDAKFLEETRNGNQPKNIRCS